MWTAVVDLPTPPLCEATVMTIERDCSSPVPHARLTARKLADRVSNSLADSLDRQKRHRRFEYMGRLFAATLAPRRGIIAGLEVSGTPEKVLDMPQRPYSRPTKILLFQPDA